LRDPAPIWLQLDRRVTPEQREGGTAAPGHGRKSYRGDGSKCFKVQFEFGDDGIPHSPACDRGRVGLDSGRTAVGEVGGRRRNRHATLVWPATGESGEASTPRGSAWVPGSDQGCCAGAVVRLRPQVWWNGALERREELHEGAGVADRLRTVRATSVDGCWVCRLGPRRGFQGHWRHVGARDPRPRRLLDRVPRKDLEIVKQVQGSAESVPPSPADLIESIRGFGYTLHSALADLVDNSLAAGAKCINLDVDTVSQRPYIAIMDDGGGMRTERLVEAMRVGTVGPLASRGVSDLGRFGLGLKTASLSQGRSLTVITKAVGEDSVSIRRWDLDHVRAVSDWQLLQEPSEIAARFIAKVSSQGSGTAVIIEKLDRTSLLDGSTADHGKHLAQALLAVRQHLGMVFHRFIAEDNLKLRLGPSLIHAWDPFLVGQSQQLASEALSYRGGRLAVDPFVLPHHSKLTDEQHEAASGPLGWNKHQGFYVYRCRRLIVPGTWLNLDLRQEEHFKLARIRLDLPNTMDSEWQLNVMKSQVMAPARLQDDFRRIAAEVRRKASEVYRVRGEREAPEQAIPTKPIWKREQLRTGVRFSVDRAHPLLRALLHSGCSHERLLSEAICLIEGTIPVAAMLQEPQRSLDGSVRLEPPTDLGTMADMVIHAEQFYVRAGRSLAESRDLVLSCEPLCRYREEITAAINARTTVGNRGGRS
jgi:hypothetical protein